MVLFDAYPRLFSPILAYPASWHISVPIVVLFVLLDSFYPLFTHWCVSSQWSLAVQHVSGLHNHFSPTFPYVVSFSLTPLIPLIPSIYLLYLCYYCLQVFFPDSRSLSCTLSRSSCYRFFWLCCNHWCWRHGSPRRRCQVSGPKTFPPDGTVVLQKINTRDRSANVLSVNYGSQRP